MAIGSTKAGSIGIELGEGDMRGGGMPEGDMIGSDLAATITRSSHRGFRQKKISYGILPSNDEWLCLFIPRAMSGSASLQPWPSWSASQQRNLVFITPFACSTSPCVCGCLALPLIILIPFFFNNNADGATQI